MSLVGHLRQSIGVWPTEGLPSIAESRCPARSHLQLDRTSGMTVSGTAPPHPGLRLGRRYAKLKEQAMRTSQDTPDSAEMFE